MILKMIAEVLVTAVLLVPIVLCVVIAAVGAVIMAIPIGIIAWAVDASISYKEDDDDDTVS